MKLFLIILLLTTMSCSSKHFKRQYPAKKSLVDLSKIKQPQKLTDSIRKRGKDLKAKGYTLFKRKDGFYAEKGDKKYLLIEGYQCTEY